MTKKYKTKIVKQVVNHDKPQIDISKALDDEKKIKPEKVFEGYKTSPLPKPKKKTAKKKKKK